MIKDRFCRVYLFAWTCFALICVLSTNTLAQKSAMKTEGSAKKSPASQNEEKWIQLFNGKNLDGWTPKFTGYDAGVNLRETFQVKDGLLKVVYDNWEKFDGEFGHLFFKTPYSHYRLRAEYRFVGEQVAGGPGWAIRNNGFMIHGQSPEVMKKDQKFPDSIEVQLLGGLGNEERGTLSICTPGTHVTIDGKLTKKHVIRGKPHTFHGDDWVTVEIEVLGNDSIKHMVDGDVVIHYTKPQLDDGTMLSSGTISIQAETAPCEFRKIELLDLSEQQ